MVYTSRKRMRGQIDNLESTGSKIKKRDDGCGTTAMASFSQPTIGGMQNQAASDNWTIYR